MRKIFFTIALAVAANLFFGKADAAEIKTPTAEKTVRTEPALEKVNSPAQDFSPTFSPNGKTMVFSSTRGAGKNGFSHLYVSHLKDGKWTSPEPLHSVNSQYNDETPFLSRDGKILLFASDRDGSVEIPRDSRGQVRVTFDIYLAQWNGKTWANPRPVQEINTQWNEKSPSISRDGRYLFFSSWPFGDIKRSRIRMLDLQSKGNVIDDLPPHINSGNQETAFVPGEDDSRYYFSSRRPGGKGGWDIWQTRFEDGKWQEPDPVPGNVNTEGHDAFLTVSQGNYFISSTFRPEKSDYDLNIEPIPDLPVVAAKTPEIKTELAELKKLKKDTSIDIRSIYFDFDSAKLKRASEPTLVALAAFLNENPKAVFEIIGHTDLNGDADYNQTLSEERAESVRDWLVEHGIDKARLQSSGKGKSQPVVAKRGRPFDQQNRRTEFKLKSEL